MTNPTQTKFAVIVVSPEGQRLRLFPRSRKTSLFTSEQKATRALDSYSKKLKVNGWRGLIYSGPADTDAKPIGTMTL